MIALQDANTGNLLGGTDTSRRNLQGYFAALAEQDIDSLLGILLKLRLHLLNVLVGFGMQLGVGASFGSSLGKSHVVELFLLFASVSVNQDLGFDLGLLHAVATSWSVAKERCACEYMSNNITNATFPTNQHGGSQWRLGSDHGRCAFSADIPV